MAIYRNYNKLEEQLEIYLAQDYIIEWRQFTSGQYRLNGELDIFPKSGKYFYVPTKKRGYYTDLLKLILSLF